LCSFCSCFAQIQVQPNFDSIQVQFRCVNFCDYVVSAIDSIGTSQTSVGTLAPATEYNMEFAKAILVCSNVTSYGYSCQKTYSFNCDLRTGFSNLICNVNAYLPITVVLLVAVLVGIIYQLYGYILETVWTCLGWKRTAIETSLFSQVISSLKNFKVVRTMNSEGGYTWFLSSKPGDKPTDKKDKLPIQNDEDVNSDYIDMTGDSVTDTQSLLSALTQDTDYVTAGAPSVSSGSTWFTTRTSHTD